MPVACIRAAIYGSSARQTLPLSLVISKDGAIIGSPNVSQEHLSV